jgi:deoxyribonuclease V
MLACVDVQYTDREAFAGCFTFDAWTDAAPRGQFTARLSSVDAYAPGAFFRRELPPILDVLAVVPDPLTLIVIDGYVWLGGHKMGLGAHLSEALEGKVAIVGVAKTEWKRTSSTAEKDKRTIVVMRGKSKTPLYVTSVGIDVEAAAENVRTMHGAHRLPTLLKAVDAFARASVSA